MSHLTQELEKVGLTKSRLAELLGVNRKTIQRMNEKVTPEVQKILNSMKEPKYTWLDIDPKEFDGTGRGTPKTINGKSVVLVSKGMVLTPEGYDRNEGVVSEEDWKARLDYTCKHGREGWSCKECLK